MALEVPALLLEKLAAHSMDTRSLSEQILTNTDSTPTGVSLWWNKLSPLLKPDKLDEYKNLYKDPSQKSACNATLASIQKSAVTPDKFISLLTNEPYQAHRYYQKGVTSGEFTLEQLQALSHGLKVIENKFKNTTYQKRSAGHFSRTTTDYLVNQLTDEEKIDIITKLAPITTVATREYQKRKNNGLKEQPIDLGMVAHIRYAKGDGLRPEDPWGNSYKDKPDALQASAEQMAGLLSASLAWADRA